MSGHTYGEHEPTENCPYCGTVCRADFVDIGVGMQQCGPYDEERPLSEDEKRTGWYAPHSPPGSSANVSGGTGQALRIAEDMGIEIYNLHDIRRADDLWNDHGIK